jgi:hypothetical protein
MIVQRTELLRRCALFLCMLLSGGSLLWPRPALLAGVLLLWLVARSGVFYVRRAMLPGFLLLGAVLLLTVARPQGFHLDSLVIRFANFLAGIVLLDLYWRAGPPALQGDLYAILRWMAVQALVTVLLAQTANFLFLPLMVQEAEYKTVLLLFTYHDMLDGSTAWKRPDGFFYEPGVFQIYLNLFLYLALFVFRSRRQSLLGVAAVFATQSTTGVVLAALQVGVFFATRYINVGSLRSRVTKTLLAVAMSVPIAFFVMTNVTDKVSGDSRGSFWARQYDLLTGLNVIAENPAIGIGFDYEQYKAAASRLGYADTELEERITNDRGNTNGVVFLLYSIGIPLALPFLIGLYRQRMFPHRKLVGTVLFVSFLSESMIFTPVFLMIIYSGLLLAPRRVLESPARVPA